MSFRLYNAKNNRLRKHLPQWLADKLLLIYHIWYLSTLIKTVSNQTPFTLNHLRRIYSILPDMPAYTDISGWDDFHHVIDGYCFYWREYHHKEIENYFTKVYSFISDEDLFTATLTGSSPHYLPLAIRIGYWRARLFNPK